MKFPAKKIAIYTFKHNHLYTPELFSLIKSLEKLDINVVYERNTANQLPYENLESTAFLPQDCDAILSIGGDGTFLRAAAWAGDSECPIMGINTGHLGYLTSFSLHDINKIIEALCNNNSKLEYRSMLKLDGNFYSVENIWPYALNEITLHKEDTSSMLYVDAYVDDIHLAQYMADGVIVSTPTGSTAYNLASGGPIVQPTFQCLLITPIAPHTLTLRPLVISPESKLQFTPRSNSGSCRISLDNRSFTIASDHSITITSAPFRTCIIRSPEDNFADTLRRKLHWAIR